MGSGATESGAGSGGGPGAGARASHPLHGVGYAHESAPRALVQLGESAVGGSGEVAEEVPVALVYNGRSHVVMMCTPGSLEDFGVGFSLAEGIVESASQVGRLEVVRASHGIEVQLEIPAALAERLVSRGRSLAGRTGCGLCGVEAIDDVLRMPPAVPAVPGFAMGALFRAGEELSALQELNARTRSVHAAAWADASGAIRVVREDVGRHNAVDKVLGALARAGTDARDGFLLVTSRASYELVQKAAFAGVTLLAAISRPTGLAVRLAEATGMTLVGLLRGRTASVYSHAQRITDRERAGSSA